MPKLKNIVNKKYKKNMENLTDIQEEIARIGYKQGLAWAHTLQSSISAGDIDVNKKIDLLLPIGEIKFENYSLLTRLTMELGTTRTGMISNSALVGLGLYTGGNSAIQYGLTTDSKAKVCYGLSAIFSASAVTSSGIAVMSRTCQISQTAALLESIGMAFMTLGNKAHLAALQLEGKPIPAHLQRYRKPFRSPKYNQNGLGFVMPVASLTETIERIPFQQIGKFTGIVITLYGYNKMIIIGYRYGQQFISKLKKKRKSQLLRKQAKFLIITCAINRYRFDPKKQSKKLCLVS